MLPILSILALASAYVKLDFGVTHGDSVDKRDFDNSFDSSHLRGYFKRDTLDLKLLNRKTFYSSDIYLGSNRDKVEVLVDTGSSDLWVPSHDVFCPGRQRYKRDLEEKLDATKIIKAASDSDYDDDVFDDDDSDLLENFTKTAASTNTCTSYGSFNTGESKSFVKNETSGDFLLSYADYTFAIGVWGRDSLALDSDGNNAVTDLSFGIANITSSEQPVFGIGLIELESSNEPYENYPLKLKNEGFIKKNAYSLYLNSLDASSGSVLFGGIDHSKYQGTLSTIPLVTTYSDNVFRRFTIVLSGIHVVTPDSNYTLFENQNAVALLDSGSTISYLRPSLLLPLVESLNGQYDDNVGSYVIPCTSDPNVYVTFDFAGAPINVPLSELIIPYQDQCIFGILELDEDDDYDVFGDNILRSGYFVYDLDDYEISIAQVKFTDDSDIEDIESAIPSAIQAKGYSSTILAKFISVSDPVTLSYPTNYVSDNGEFESFSESDLESSRSRTSDSESFTSDSARSTTRSSGSGNTVAGAATTGGSTDSSSDNDGSSSSSTANSGSISSLTSLAVFISLICYGVWV